MGSGLRAIAAAAALALVSSLLIALAGAAAASAATGWGKPFELSKPGTLDLFGPELAFSPQGASAAAFGTEDVDVPGTEQAQLALRSPSGAISAPRALTGARRVLALTYDGRQLELLTGTSPAGTTCCSTAQAMSVGPGGAASKPSTLVGGLTGATQGQLLTLSGGAMMAAVATERGVWVAQTTRGDTFGGQHRISDKGQEPIALAAAWLGGGSTIVAWTAGMGVIGATQPRSIFYATGSSKAAPHRTRVALTVPAGHRIDELAVVRRRAAATLAWIDSWYDGKGRYHARAEAADLTAHPQIRALSPDGRLASGLTAESDAAGDEGIAWQSCTAGGSCTVQAAGRPAGGTFRAAKTLGGADPSGAPALAVGPNGRVLVAWVRGGHPVASVGFAAPRQLSSTTYADAPAVAYGPKRQALVAWTQGTLNPSVVAAAYRG